MGFFLNFSESRIWQVPRLLEVLPVTKMTPFNPRMIWQLVSCLIIEIIEPFRPIIRGIFVGVT